MTRFEILGKLSAMLVLSEGLKENFQVLEK